MTEPSGGGRPRPPQSLVSGPRRNFWPLSTWPLTLSLYLSPVLLVDKSPAFSTACLDLVLVPLGQVLRLVGQLLGVVQEVPCGPPRVVGAAARSGLVADATRVRPARVAGGRPRRPTRSSRGRW